MNLTRRRTAATLAALMVVLPAPAVAHAAPLSATGVAELLERSTIPDLQRAMDARTFTSGELTRALETRIAQVNPALRAVIRTNPDAGRAAADSDARRRAGAVRGPLDGIPVLLKDNTDTADAMRTTAGSTALDGARPARDAHLVTALRAAGAVVLGKTNLSVWSNFRSALAIPGWSPVGGQTRNPYARDRGACGSSSGAAAAVAAGLAVVAIGTDTDGSVLCPASVTATVGIRPTVGVVSRSGVVPITAQQDTPGPIARTVTDAALTLAAIAGPDAADPATASSAEVRIPTDLRPEALRGKRIGLWRAGRIGIDPAVDRAFDDAVRRLRTAGAVVVDGADVPAIDDVVVQHLVPALMTEFEHDMNAYLAATPGAPRDLAALIAFGRAHAAVELPLFGQDLFEAAQASDGDVTAPAHRAHRAAATDAARRAIDDVLRRLRLDAIVTPTAEAASPVDRQGPPERPLTSATRQSSTAGYPQLTVPAGYDPDGLPLGLSFLAGRGADAELVRFAHALEQVERVRRAPSGM
ncbi:amidase family protein [Tsukamurella pulmonis]|uniref:amidase family protein n=2 Tax=Tsukamurella pulmonis TaxID=47312 RepID=UPI000B1F6B31|nr:amidase family protein [Tsukamurella pulmonis]